MQLHLRGEFMKNLKRSRTLSLLAGSLFLINTIIALEGNFKKC